MMQCEGHWRHPGKQALASVPPHWTMTAQAGFGVKTRAPDFWKRPCIAVYRAPKDHTNIRILQTVISGIPLKLGLGTRM